MAAYAKPRHIDEALALLAGGEDWRVLAGGTDFYPAAGSGYPRGAVLDINGLEELRGFADSATHLVIGARTTWSEVLARHLPPSFDALKEAAREVGSVQIQNVATVAGNICNASPAADGVPPLLVLDAEVELRSLGGIRYLPIGEFIRGNRKTALRRGELVTAIRVPNSSCSGRSAFFKLGARRYLVISIAMAAVRLVVGAGGTVEGAALAVGACSAAARRLVGLERQLLGLSAGPALADAALAADYQELAPIDDVRGSADYRRQAVREIVARALLAAAAEPPDPRKAAA